VKTPFMRVEWLDFMPRQMEMEDVSNRVKLPFPGMFSRLQGD
jgi:hypothetical protein